MFSALFYTGVSVVIVDTLEVFGFDLVPCDMRVGVEAGGDVTNQIFDEHGVFIGPFGDVLFIRAFEQGLEFAAGTGLHQFNDVLDPNGFIAAQLDSHFTALVVGAMNTDRLGAGA